MLDLLARRADRGRPVSDIEGGYISTVSCLLGNIALKVGHSLAWDPKAGQAIKDPEVNRLLQRPYHAPWRHPQDNYS